MRKILLSVFMMVAVVAAQAQTIVDTTAQNKKVVLEEFTGIYCGYCPDGHRLANLVKASAPNDVFLINVHSGSYATPQGADPDFRTPFGDAIAGQSGLAGYPAGTVNRHLFPGMQQASGTAMSRGDFMAASTQILAEPSYVNVGVESTVDAQTRVMTVNVEVYFTGTTAPANMLLNVALTQDNVEGPQSGASANPTAVLPNGKYNHMHMLRHMLTGQWGDSITTTAQGTLVSRTYTYTLPADINNVPLELGNINVVAFVTESHQEIISADEAHPSYTNIAHSENAMMEWVNNDAELCDPTIEPKIRVKNIGQNTITAMTITYDVNGGTASTYNWTGSLATFSADEVVLPAINFTNQASNTVNVTITDVNGLTDGDVSDNTASNTGFGVTTNTTSGTEHTFIFVQDRYGSESTWEILDANGTAVASGGPYTDLSGNGTQTHTKQVTLNALECYTVKVYDSYGDGINSGYGAGSYKLKNPYWDVVSSNGVFTSEDYKLFNYTSTVAIQDVDVVGDVKVYPNPTNGLVNLEFTLNTTSDVSYTVFNAMGQEIQAVQLGTQMSGNYTQAISLEGQASGIYMIQLVVDGQVSTHRITVR